MLQLKKVQAGYGRVTILEDVNVEVAKGEVVTIVGANGAGKTTTLRAVSGLIPVSAGEIFLTARKLRLYLPTRS
jgi:branched-chain amino acid transport system ATP-binding protein